jgi:hypothetical protein
MPRVPRITLMFFLTSVVVLTLLAFPAWAKKGHYHLNEGEPKHEINELQNKLHRTDDPSKRNHIEGKIDALQDRRQLGLDDVGLFATISDAFNLKIDPSK